MFKGSYHHRLDPKGRLPVPAAFRRALADAQAKAVVVTPVDGCLAAYPPAEWARLESQLLAMPSFDRRVKTLTRLLASRAVDCELDVQGRILLPPTLRSAVGLGREAVVIGVLNRFEIWNPDTWNSFVKDSERLLDDVSLEVPWPVTSAPPGPGAAPLLAPDKPRS